MINDSRKMIVDARVRVCQCVSMSTWTCNSSLDLISNTSPLIAVLAPPEIKLYAASPD